MALMRVPGAPHPMTVRRNELVSPEFTTPTTFHARCIIFTVAQWACERRTAARHRACVACQAIHRLWTPPVWKLRALYNTINLLAESGPERASFGSGVLQSVPQPGTDHWNMNEVCVE